MGKENTSSADLYTVSDTSVSATKQQKYLCGVTSRIMAGRNAKRGWWCLFRDWRSQVRPKVKLLFCSSTKNCYVHCSMMFNVWNDASGALHSIQSLLPMGTWQRYPRCSPLSFNSVCQCGISQQEHFATQPSKMYLYGSVTTGFPLAGTWEPSEQLTLVLHLMQHVGYSLACSRWFDRRCKKFNGGQF